MAFDSLTVISREDAISRGLKVFFTGVPCKHGHTSPRSSASGVCMQCNRERSLKNYIENRDALRAKARERYALNSEYRDAAKRRAREQRQRDPDGRRDYDAKYYQENAETIKQRSREWSANNSARKRLYNKQWNASNPELARKHQRAYEKRRKSRDPVHAMAERIGSAIRGSLIRGGYTKRNRVAEILGCSFEEFARSLERQFLKGMTWGNRDRWHIDHIVPVSSAKTEEEIIALHHFTNLRPVWERINREKADKREFLI